MKHLVKSDPIFWPFSGPPPCPTVRSIYGDKTKFDITKGVISSSQEQLREQVKYQSMHSGAVWRVNIHQEPSSASIAKLRLLLMLPADREIAKGGRWVAAGIERRNLGYAVVSIPHRRWEYCR